MSTKLVAVDVDPKRGVMLRSDYTLMQIHQTASFLCYPNSFHHSPCTIRSEGFCCGVLYDINLGATHTTILSTRGVEIPISLVSSATDSIQRCVAVFKVVLVPTSDLKSEFLCQSS